MIRSIIELLITADSWRQANQSVHPINTSLVLSYIALTDTDTHPWTGGEMKFQGNSWLAPMQEGNHTTDCPHMSVYVCVYTHTFTSSGTNGTIVYDKQHSVHSGRSLKGHLENKAHNTFNLSITDKFFDSYRTMVMQFHLNKEDNFCITVKLCEN